MNNDIKNPESGDYFVNDRRQTVIDSQAQEIVALKLQINSLTDALEFYAQLKEQYRGVKLNSIAVKALEEQKK